MIRRERDVAFLLIAQHDHALLAGRLAAHVGNALFHRPEPKHAFVTAVSLHDSGWPVHDDRPTLNPRGQPLDVFETPALLALSAWSGAPQRASAEDPYAGLLVSLHAMALSRLAMSTALAGQKSLPPEPRIIFEINKFQHKQAEIQENLRRTLGMATDLPLTFGLAEDSTDPLEQRLVYHFRLLQAMDQISLAACCTTPPMDRSTPLPTGPGLSPMQLDLRRDGDDLIVHPWPFDVPRIDCSIPYRPVPTRSYESDEQFHQIYHAAPTQDLQMTIRPE